MSILINKDTKVITQGITGKTGQFHTEKCIEYANGKNCFVAGVNPKKAGEKILDVPIFGTVKEAAANTGATVSVMYVPPAGVGRLDQEPLRWRKAPRRAVQVAARRAPSGRGSVSPRRWRPHRS